MVGWPPVFDVFNLETEALKCQAIDKNINQPNLVVFINGIIQRNREKVGLRPVLSLYVLQTKSYK